MILGLIKVLLVLGFAVALHELGHYLAIRAVGRVPPIFSFGMGPAIFSLTDRRGTEWRWSLLPVGGYVEQPLSGMSRLQQIVVAAAGPLTNLVSGFLLCWALLFFYGYHVQERGETSYLYFQNTPLVKCEGPQQEWAEASNSVKARKACLISFAYLVRCMGGTKRFVYDLVSDTRQATKNLKGPVGIITVIWGAVSLPQVLFLAVQLAFSLGLFNLLPFFPLDGSRIVCACLGIDLEKGGKMVELVSSTCLALILLLALVVSYKDVVTALFNR